MLDRFRDFVKRLELPQGEEGDVVYRIIDDDLIAVEVTTAQYGIWRLQHDVAARAIVGQDTIESVMVRTTFSIMPENRGYKPFGTSAFQVTTLDSLPQYSMRYDTWQEAEQGHRITLNRVRRDHARARAADDRAEALAGVAGEVRLAISADLPALFRVDARSEEAVSVVTPLTRTDGSVIEMSVHETGTGFHLSASIEVAPNDSVMTLSKLRSDQVDRLCQKMGVSLADGSLNCGVEDASQLGGAIVRLSQAVVCFTYLANERR